MKLCKLQPMSTSETSISNLVAIPKHFAIHLDFIGRRKHLQACCKLCRSSLLNPPAPSLKLNYLILAKL